MGSLGQEAEEAEEAEKAEDPQNATGTNNVSEDDECSFMLKKCKP